MDSLEKLTALPDAYIYSELVVNKKAILHTYSSLAWFMLATLDAGQC